MFKILSRKTIRFLERIYTPVPDSSRHYPHHTADCTFAWRGIPLWWFHSLALALASLCSMCVHGPVQGGGGILSAIQGCCWLTGLLAHFGGSQVHSSPHLCPHWHWHLSAPVWWTEWRHARLLCQGSCAAARGWEISLATSLLALPSTFTPCNLGGWRLERKRRLSYCLTLLVLHVSKFIISCTLLFILCFLLSSAGRLNAPETWNKKTK